MLKSYLINLDKDVARLSFFSANFERLNLAFERMSAVDGRLFSEADFQQFVSERPRTNNKVWLRGQMGCFLSHYHVWRKVAEGSDAFAAVFEDDVHISDDLKNILSADDWIPRDVDIIRLETTTNRVRLTKKPIATCGERNAYGVRSTTWCTGAYIISRQAAQKFIELPAKCHDTSDVIMYNFKESAIASKLNILQFNPAPCTQDRNLLTAGQTFTSNIELVADAKTGLQDGLSRLTASRIGMAIYKSLYGYKRIHYK